MSNNKNGNKNLNHKSVSKKSGNNNLTFSNLLLLCKKWILEHKKESLGIILLIVFLIILVIAGGKIKSQKKPSNGGSSSGNASELTANGNKDILKLINNYYKAYAKGDSEKVSEYALPLSENEAAYIALFGEYVESYDVNNIYTVPGKDKNSYLVSVEMAIKFKDVDTLAPGLDFFYVTQVEDGTYYINNLYSQFNYRTNEYSYDEAIEKMISKYENREDVKEIQAQVQDAYDSALASDEQLETMVNVTIEEEVSNWMGTIVLAQNQTPPETVLTIADASGKTEEDPENEEEEENPEDIVVEEHAQTKEQVNLRAGASTTSESIRTLKGGQYVIVLAVDTWGEWSYVKVGKNTKGFIRNDFLTTCDTKYSCTGTEGYPEKDAKVTLADTTNLMNTMTDKGKVISQFNSGTSVTVIMSYLNGYTKVKVNGKTGYVQTSQLEY